MPEQISKQKQKSDDIFVINSEGLNLEELEVKSGESKFFLKTTITTNEKDLVNDVVTKGCMDSMVKQLKDRTVKLDFEHESFRGKSKKDQELNKTRVPLGKRVGFERKEDQIDVTWQLNTNWKKFDEKGNVVYNFEEIKDNIDEEYYDGTSIAYIPTKTKKEERKGGDVRLLNDLKLLNVALTGNPVNTGAKVREVFRKSIEASEEKEEKSINEVVKKLREDVDKIKSNSHLINKKEEKMPEEKQKDSETEKEAEEEKAEESDEAEEAEEDKSDDSEQEQEDDTEEKSELKSILKDFKKDLKSIKEKVEEHDKALSKPQHKGKSEQRKGQKSQVDVTPLGMIQ